MWCLVGFAAKWAAFCLVPARAAVCAGLAEWLFSSRFLASWILECLGFVELATFLAFLAEVVVVIGVFVVAFVVVEVFVVIVIVIVVVFLVVVPVVPIVFVPSSIVVVVVVSM